MVQKEPIGKAKLDAQTTAQKEDHQDQLDDPKDDVRILLIGDPGVGKTSLIYSLVNDEFDPNLPARMAEIRIPANLTVENVPLCIVDYSEREQDHQELVESIQQSHVICVVYVANDDDSLDRVATHWIPTVRKCQTKDNGTHSYKPILLVANKTDLLDGEEPLDRVSAIIQEYVDIEAYIEVSALSQKNVVELFASAQKAVTYPLAPLFDPQLRVLTKKCKTALTEIFALCDLDGDGLLSDHELNLFQENCFGTPLQRDALDDLKLIIKQSTVDGIVNNSMTQTGFLFLHALSIDKGHHEFTWQVLKKFNYDNQVDLCDDRINYENLTQPTAGRLTGGDDISLRGRSFLDASDGVLADSSSDRAQNYSIQSASSDETSDSSSESLRSAHDINWMKEHSNLIGAGIGLTLAALISMLALRYAIQGAFRS